MGTTTGSTGDDTLSATSGDDTLIGLDGTDVALFGGNMADYTITSAGPWVLVTDTNTNDGDDGTEYLHGIEVLRFADGDLDLTLTNDEFQVNTVTTGDQGQPSIIGLADGGFLMVWQDESGQDGDQSGIQAQRYDSAGEPVGSEFQVNTGNLSRQTLPQVTQLTGGNVVFTWSSTGIDGTERGIAARIFDSSGNPVTGDFTVDLTDTLSGFSTAGRAQVEALGGLLHRLERRAAGRLGCGRLRPGLQRQRLRRRRQVPGQQLRRSGDRFRSRELGQCRRALGRRLRRRLGGTVQRRHPSRRAPVRQLRKLARRRVSGQYLHHRQSGLRRDRGTHRRRVRRHLAIGGSAWRSGSGRQFRRHLRPALRCRRPPLRVRHGHRVGQRRHAPRRRQRRNPLRRGRQRHPRRRGGRRYARGWGGRGLAPRRRRQRQARRRRRWRHAVGWCRQRHASRRGRGRHPVRRRGRQ